MKNNAGFFNWLWEISFNKVLGKKMGHSDTTTLHYTTLKNSVVQYTTVKCSSSNTSPLIKQREQTQVVSPCQIRHKTMSEPTRNKINYTTYSTLHPPRLYYTTLYQISLHYTCIRQTAHLWNKVDTQKYIPEVLHYTKIIVKQL